MLVNKDAYQRETLTEWPVWLPLIWLGISLKMAQIIHFGVLATNTETNKHPPKMINLNTLGAYCNEYNKPLIQYLGIIT